ncbi:hypothetical protein HMPREF1549_00226 [Actinomyces johnsonii F0510]|uniref:Uncharacterized protein n=1 Tax=Actinomyces johnsonii F0510 TaxID=1227262 RepID=U1RXN8_9ACTO|nr:hypothetical protein HMPREF1549_00226 [Actinomyces johnsonii F0510]
MAPGGVGTGDAPDSDGDGDAVVRLTGSGVTGGIGVLETSEEVSTVTSMGMGRPQTWVTAALIGPRACSTMSLAKADPTTRTRVPSTSMRWVMRIMDILPWPSSPELESTSRAESHLVLAASGTTDS